MDGMNRFLAQVINVVNGFVALAIMLGCAIGGAILGEPLGPQDVGAFIGLLIGGLLGLVLAAYFCGLLALFIDMRNSLLGIANSQRKIRELLENQTDNNE